MTEGTTLDPGDYERQLLERYADGSLSIDEAIALVTAESTTEGALPVYTLVTSAPLDGRS